MAAIVLPSDPWPSGVSFRPVRAGFDLPGTFGVDQRVSRLGDRWAMDVQMPPMPYGDTALRWVARLSRARGEVVRMRVPQPGLAVGDPGDVLVNGAGQSGTSLIVDGVNAPTSLREGQWVSITTGGRSYLHLVAADLTMTTPGAGKVMQVVTTSDRTQSAIGAVAVQAGKTYRLTMRARFTAIASGSPVLRLYARRLDGSYTATTHANASITPALEAWGAAALNVTGDSILAAGGAYLRPGFGIVTVTGETTGQFHYVTVVDLANPGVNLLPSTFAADGTHWTASASGDPATRTPITANANYSFPIVPGMAGGTITLDPMLRVSPADNSPVEIEEPVIEGFLEAGQEWTVDVARHVGLSFTIRERR